MDDIYKTAAAAQPLAAGFYRVVVNEASARLTLRDFPSLSEAKAYADDVASEADDHRPLAYVYDSNLARVYTGRPYNAK